ncbi:MAG: hypothetical protein KI793_26085 [Rivularia sp. (in: Bacteria)]|nr:hypothetical protein [Rivularia sp. MS3]
MVCYLQYQYLQIRRIQNYQKAEIIQKTIQKQYQKMLVMKMLLLKVQEKIL